MEKMVIDHYFCKIITALNSGELEVVLQPRPRLGRHEYMDGLCKWDGTIVIRNNPKKVNMVLTLLHEMLHYILNKDGSKYDSEEEEEEVVELLARELFCGLSQNQLDALRRYISTVSIRQRRGRSRAARKK